jgi:hypothetical protein
MYKRPANILVILFLIMMISAFSGQRDFFGSFKSGSVYEIKCGNAIMNISALGGRIISCRIGELEFLTGKDENENFGSTFWTAPQSDWGWPPYAVLDNDEYSVEKIGLLLKMTSKPDLKSGFQVEKKWLAVDNKYIRIEYLIRNISEKEKAVGAWEVSRVPVGGLAFFPDGGDAKVPESNLKPELQKEGINWISFDKPSIPDHLKLFSTASEGWLAYAYKNVLFIKQFPDTRPENYSPEQGEVEIYINKVRSYIELENHGEYKHLQPGESLTYVVNWYLLPIPGAIKTEAGNRELVSFVRKQVDKSE